MTLRLIIIFLVLSTSASSAQNWFFNKADNERKDSFLIKTFIQGSYKWGKFAPSHTDGLKYLEQNPFNGFELRVGVVGDGRKKWHQLHNFPTYGVGVQKFWYCPKDNILGNPMSAFLFFNEPVIRINSFALSYDFSLGLSTNWKRYNQYTNPDQKAIGSDVNFLVGLGLQFESKLSKKVDLTFGGYVNHYSNGRLRSPNRGINMYGLNTSIRYRIQKNSPDKKHLNAMGNVFHDPMKFEPMTEFYAVLSGGMVTTFRDVKNRRIHFAAGSLVFDAARHYNTNGKIGVGIDLFYDGSLMEQFEGKSSLNAWWPGVHLSHEYMVQRWTLVTQGGVNLIQPADKGIWYGRISVRYDFSEHLFLRTGLRVYDTFISDFIECGIGYTFYTRRSAKD